MHAQDVLRPWPRDWAHKRGEYPARAQSSGARPRQLTRADRSTILRPHGACHSRERASHVRGQARATTTKNLPACTTEGAAHKYGGSTRCETVVQASSGSCTHAPDVRRPSPRDWAHKRGEYPARAQSSGARPRQHGLRARTGHHRPIHSTAPSECLTGCPRRMKGGEGQHVICAAQDLRRARAYPTQPLAHLRLQRHLPRHAHASASTSAK
jgi:hypothetical protein